jgi:Protein of unknown function (DUF1566)/Repeat of unknown function (DUF5648)
MKTRATLHLTVCVAAVFLSGCGGGSSTSDSGASGKASATIVVPGPSRDTDLEDIRAQLNRAELERAAKRGAIGDSKKSLSSKAFAGTTINVYRFFNRKTGAHFYTSGETEKTLVQATNPLFAYEGLAFLAGISSEGGLSPVHRFYNSKTGVHFYTISEDEKALIEASQPQFVYEGVAYFASLVGGKGLTPLNRFYQTSKGFHFYSTSESETARIRKSLPQYRYEGASYYVPGPEVGVTHTGMTEDDCYAAGSDTLVNCSSAGALALSPHQDGHRSNYNRMAFGEIMTGGDGLQYLPSNCVKDEVTGLVWEGFGTHVDATWTLYTNFLDPLLGDVNAHNNAASYVSRINALALCGFSDWRLPNMSEINNLITPNADFVAVHRVPSVSGWTSDTFAPDSRQAWAIVDQKFGGSPFGQDNLLGAAPLVRGAAAAARTQSCPSTTNRFVGNGAEVLDTETGLTWSRCGFGQTWGGGSCVGTERLLTHEQALAQAPAGWRLPNIKELASIVDRGCPHPAIDHSAFPGAATAPYWSSTPWKIFPHTGHIYGPGERNTSNAMAVDFSYGATYFYPRNARTLPVRWVRLGS